LLATLLSIRALDCFFTKYFQRKLKMIFDRISLIPCHYCWLSSFGWLVSRFIEKLFT